jgi:hypothetical protein
MSTNHDYQQKKQVGLAKSNPTRDWITPDRQFRRQYPIAQPAPALKKIKGNLLKTSYSWPIFN